MRALQAHLAILEITFFLQRRPSLLSSCVDNILTQVTETIATLVAALHQCVDIQDLARYTLHNL
jgi:hypothetical protein